MHENAFFPLWNAILDTNHRIERDNAYKPRPYSHPLFLAERYISGPFKLVRSIFKPSTESLVKLLMFGAFSRVRSSNVTDDQILKEELARFPYQRKKTFSHPYFTPVDLALKHDKDIFPALTDVGLCNVYNGETMASTYSSTKKHTEFIKLLDPRESFKPKMITGTGKISERTFWLNVADRNVDQYNLFS